MPPKKPFRVSGELHFTYINDEDLKKCYDCLERVMFEYKSQSMLSTVSVLVSVMKDISNEITDRSSVDLPAKTPTKVLPKRRKFQSPAKRRLT